MRYLGEVNNVLTLTDSHKNTGKYPVLSRSALELIIRTKQERLLGVTATVDHTVHA